MKRFAILFLFVLPLVSSAKVRLPAIFSDHLVLQQNYGNPIWGWAQPGEKVTVSTSWGEEHSLTTGENGKWMAVVYAPAASLGHKLTIRGSNRIVLRNVAVGEVWLCAGQSNMGWSVGNSFEAEGRPRSIFPVFGFTVLLANIGMNLSRKTGTAWPVGNPVIRNPPPRLPQSPTILERSSIRN